jgi:hypothetical protein
MNRSPASAPIFRVIGGPAAGAEFRIDQHECLIGRGSGVAISLDDQDISRRHARLLVGPDGGVVIADLGSTNGTWVNDAPLHGRHSLRHGDQVRVGGMTLRFHQAPGAGPSAHSGPPTSVTSFPDDGWPAPDTRGIPAPADPWGGPSVHQHVEVQRGRNVQVAGRDAVHTRMHIGSLKIGLAGLVAVAALLVVGFVVFPPVSLDSAVGRWENAGMTRGGVKQDRTLLDIAADGAFRLRGGSSVELPAGAPANAATGYFDKTVDCTGSVDVQWHRLAFRVASGSCANFFARLVQDGQALDAYDEKTAPTTLRRSH